MKAAKQNYNIHENKCIKIWKKREKEINHLMYMGTIIFIFQIYTKRYVCSSLLEQKTPFSLLHTRVTVCLLPIARTQSLHCFHDHPDRKRAQESIATCFPDRTFPPLPSCLGGNPPFPACSPSFLTHLCRKSSIKCMIAGKSQHT